MKEEKDKCTCEESCTCEDICNEGCGCTEECCCNDDCHCDETCNCNDDCHCDETCNCNDECHCDENKKDKKKHKKHDLDKKIEELELKIKSLEEQNLREKAESINFRRRKEEETARILKFCNEDLIKDVLPTIDNFERAIKMDDDNLEDEVSKFLAGVKMIYCNLIGILEKYGVKAIDGANKPFDPTYHQAVMMEHVDGLEPGMVIEVLQKGYLLKDRVIRPAMVKVSE